MNNVKTKKKPEFGYAVLLLLVLAAILVCGLSVIKAPLAVIMFISWLVVNLFAIRL